MAGAGSLRSDIGELGEFKKADGFGVGVFIGAEVGVKSTDPFIGGICVDEDEPLEIGRRPNGRCRPPYPMKPGTVESLQ